MGLLSWLSDLTDEAKNDEKDAPAADDEGGGFLSTLGKALGFDDANEKLKPGNQSYDDQKKALAPGGTAKTTTRLNVRETPSTGGTKMFTLDKGEEVTILAAADWANVVVRGEYGWCHTNYLQASGGNPAAADDVDPSAGGGAEPAEPSGGSGGGGGTSDGPLKKIEPGDFDTQDYAVGDSKTYTVASRGSGKNRKTAEATPAEYTAAILKEAGLDPSSWYGGFTKTTFLGRKTRDPIHTELAAHLKNAEAKIVAEHKKDGETVKELGDRLGMSRGQIVGSRKEPTGAALSMHLFGLAIDIDPKSHRYLRESSDKASVRKVSNWVFGRAGELLKGEKVEYVGSEDYDAHAAYDKLLEDYFGLIDASDDVLQSKLDGATGEWAGKSVADARKQITDDLDTIAWAWHGKNKREANHERIKTEGLMNFEKELVEGLGLHWGAQYGDLMHFDMRNTGVGKKVHSAIRRYKNAKKAELKAE